MPTLYNARTTPLSQSGVNPLAASMRLAYDLTGHDTRARWEAYDYVGATAPTATQSNAPTAVTYNAIPGLRFTTFPSATYTSTTDYGLQVGLSEYTACVLLSTGPALPANNGFSQFIRVDNSGSNDLLGLGVAFDAGVGWVCAPSGAGGTVTGQGRTYFGADRTVALFIRRSGSTVSAWRVIVGVDVTAQRVTNDSTTDNGATANFNNITARRVILGNSGTTGAPAADAPAMHAFRFHGAALSEAEMLAYANDWWAVDAFATDTTAPTLTAPTATAISDTAASGTVSTDEANGTLYHLTTTGATATATEVKAGASQAVTATGVQTASITGLTASTAYYTHYLHRDEVGNDSAVSTTAQFTTAAPPVALTTEPLKNNTGTLLANETGATMHIYEVATGNKVATKTGQTTNASGIMTAIDGSLVSGTEYRVVIVLASGAEGLDKVTAA